MSTAAASAAVLAAAASNTSTQAHRIQEERKCKEFVGSFDSYTATVSEQKYYAECVDMLYPDPVSGGTVLFIKIVLVCAMVGMVVGSIRGWINRMFGISDVLLFGLWGGCVGAFIPAFILGCILAIKFIVS
jgi:hypothetical protein